MNKQILPNRWFIWAIVAIGVVGIGVLGYVQYVLIQDAASDNIISTSFVKTTQPENTAYWQTYRNEKYGFEFRYPTSWAPEKVNWNVGNNEIQIENFIASPQVSVLTLGIENNIEKLSLEDFAKKEIRENNCLVTLEKTGNNCPETGPVDHIVDRTAKGLLYTLSCSATSEDYIYITTDPKENIIKLYYRDDFENNWCEAKKIAKFKQILSTFKFIE